MENISIKIPDRVLEAIDYLVDEGIFSSRSSFIRTAINFFLVILMNSSKLNDKQKQNLIDRYLGNIPAVIINA